MKIRIKGNPLRFRVTRSEVEKLFNAGRIEETVWLGTRPSSRLMFALEHADTIRTAGFRSALPEVAVTLPSSQVLKWRNTDQVGIYATVDLGPRGALELLIEKDFACLDRSDEDNLDAFPNPLAGMHC